MTRINQSIGLVSLLAALGCAGETVGEPNTGIPNPASVYCTDQGGRLEIRTDASGGQQGICVFTDGSECDEWAFFRGECGPRTKP